MAIALDATSGSQNTTGSATSLTFSHTCTGSNRILFVAASSEDSNGGHLDEVSGVTYNGVAMTKIDSQQHGISGAPLFQNGWESLWYLVAPATGANNVVVTLSNADTIRAGSVSYTGAKQSSVPDNKTKGSSTTSSPLTLSLNTVADNCWTVMGVAGYQNLTASTGFTLRDSQGSRHLIGDSNGVVTPAGAKSMSITFAGDGYPGGVMASFEPLTTTAYSMSVTVGAFTLTGVAATMTYHDKDIVLSCGTGVFVLTGVASLFHRVSTMTASVGAFILTGNPISTFFTGWTNNNKNSSSYSNGTKHSSSWTNRTEN